MKPIEKTSAIITIWVIAVLMINISLTEQNTTASNVAPFIFTTLGILGTIVILFKKVQDE